MQQILGTNIKGLKTWKFPLENYFCVKDRKLRQKNISYYYIYQHKRWEACNWVISFTHIWEATSSGEGVASPFGGEGVVSSAFGGVAWGRGGGGGGDSSSSFSSSDSPSSPSSSSWSSSTSPGEAGTGGNCLFACSGRDSEIWTLFLEGSIFLNSSYQIILIIEKWRFKFLRFMKNKNYNDAGFTTLLKKGMESH